VSLRDLRDRVAAGALSHPGPSRLVGRLADLKLPPVLLRPLLLAYVRLYGVDMGEAAEPLDAYATFNAFFTRRLKEGCRPLPSEAGVLVSPADSRLTSIGPVPAEGRLEQVKGRPYALDELLGSAEEAARFRAGVHATLYLSPSMYHRVHSPVDGRVRSWSHLPGRLFPVNPRAVRTVDRLFARNERVAIFLESDLLGHVAVIMVGATNVGRITLSFAPLATNMGMPGGTFRPEREIRLRRGDELGAFNLGSTVVLVGADGRLAPMTHAGEIVRVNQALFRRT